MAKKPFEVKKPKTPTEEAAGLKANLVDEAAAEKPIPEMKFPNKKAAKPPSIKEQKAMLQIPDPLADVEETGDLEADTEAEFSAILDGYAKRQKQDQDRFRLAVDTEFWFAVCFQSREQKDRFLAAMGWIINGDKYIDGTWLCEQYGIQIEPVRLANKKTRKDKKWQALARKNGVVGLTDDGSITYVDDEEDADSA